MKRNIALFFLCLIGVQNQSVYASIKTPAGTVIGNRAVLQFSLGTDYQADSVSSVSSNEVVFKVAEIVDVAVTTLDATPVNVNSPDRDCVLTFKVTNTGNGTDTYRLRREQQLTGDRFNPEMPFDRSSGIYLENNLQAGLQRTGLYADQVYIEGHNNPTLSALAEQVVYVLSDISEGLTSRDEGKAQLIALTEDTRLQHLTVGQAVMGDRASDVPRVLGASLGIAKAEGVYLVSGLIVSFEKTFEMQKNTLNADRPIIRYFLNYRLAGEGKAHQITMTDRLPPYTQYVANSLTLDGIAQTDTIDKDALSVINQEVTLVLGDKTPPYQAKVAFDVMVMD